MLQIGKLYRKSTTSLNAYCQETIETILTSSDTAGNILPIPRNDAELKEAVRKYAGINIPDTQICPDHNTPFRAFADAFFARHSMVVIKASRGFGGKSVLLATLSYMEAILLGAYDNLLGGSGEQSQRVYDYMTGEDPNMPSTFWGCEHAPIFLLSTPPTTRTTKLINGGRIRVLTASQRSVRGPHPQRLRIDEVDEMDINVFNAAMGQAMSTEKVKKQTVLSSTQQYADGTMAEVLRRARDNGWPVYEWCYKETSAEGGWLLPSEVESKKREVPASMWLTEYELQEPSPESRAIDTSAVKSMFNKELGHYSGTAGKEYIFEEYDPGGSYVTGADWARKTDWTVIITLRIDITPMRIVAFRRTQREPWPVMVNDYFEGRLDRYPGDAGHDATGLGDVVAGYLSKPVEPIIMVGRKRADLLSNYVSAIERGEIISPFIDWMEAEHRTASVDDLYGSGHLPDSISAGAIAYSRALHYTDYSSYDDDLGQIPEYTTRYD